MAAAVIDGKAFAARLRETVAQYAREFEQRAGRKAALATTLPIEVRPFVGEAGER